MNNARAILIVIVLAVVGISNTMALESSPPLPVEDRVFIIDRSASIGPEMLQVEITLVQEYICGSLSLDPATSPFGLAVILFNNVSSLLIPYTVVTNVGQAQKLCDQIADIFSTGGSTSLIAALDLTIP